MAPCTDETQALIYANRPEVRIFNLLELGEEDTHPLIQEAYHRAVVGRSSEGLPRDIWVLIEAAYELAVTHSTAPEADTEHKPPKREYDGVATGDLSTAFSDHQGSGSESEPPESHCQS
jgi:hypothetical protein